MQKPNSDRLIPALFMCFKEGYSLSTLRSDMIAGLTVAIVALPLAMAMAVASGASPDKGLVTSVVAGFFISFLGGSRVQIGGPTGAFVVVIFDVIARYGLDGLIGIGNGRYYSYHCRLCSYGQAHQIYSLSGNYRLYYRYCRNYCLISGQGLPWYGD